jgi:hypothetical protein
MLFAGAPTKTWQLALALSQLTSPAPRRPNGVAGPEEVDLASPFRRSLTFVEHCVHLQSAPSTTGRRRKATAAPRALCLVQRIVLRHVDLSYWFHRLNLPSWLVDVQDACCAGPTRRPKGEPLTEVNSLSLLKPGKTVTSEPRCFE